MDNCLYQKKPVVIKAWQFTKENFDKGVPKFLKPYIEDKYLRIWKYDGGKKLNGNIHTLEGDLEISENDYIIQGVKGEIYPCKPDIFDMTYEKIKEE